jgi:hypothetical protein
VIKSPMAGTFTVVRESTAGCIETLCPHLWA